MEVERFDLQHLTVERDPHSLVVVVDGPERGQRARNHSQVTKQPVGGAEGETASPETLSEVLEVDVPVLEGDHQPHAAFLVPQEQALRVGTGQVAPKAACFVDGEDGRMLDGAGINAPFVEGTGEV